MSQPSDCDVAAARLIVVEIYRAGINFPGEVALANVLIMQIDIKLRTFCRAPPRAAGEMARVPYLEARSELVRRVQSLVRDALVRDTQGAAKRLLVLPAQGSIHVLHSICISFDSIRRSVLYCNRPRPRRRSAVPERLCPGEGALGWRDRCRARH